jgi:DNA-binding CsgD family transcriptional regulator/tetratricopeptide (TPR) repeat protein
MTTVIDEPSRMRGTVRSRARPAGSADMRGRDAEWRLVGELLRRAHSGTGGVMLADGERGIGKSLLLREAGREAFAQGFSLAAAAADPLGGQIPFFALRMAVGPSAGVTGETGHRSGPDFVQLQIAELRERLVRRTTAAPVLVCLDDLQWASQETLLALRMLPRELARYPLAWILARTTVCQDKSAHLFTSLEAEGAYRVTLQPLDAEVVMDMLAEAFGAPPDESLLALAAETAGNPLLLDDLIGGLREENAIRVTNGLASVVSERVPGRIGRAARPWLDDLSAPTRRLLGTAAVLGRTFRLSDIAEILDETAAALLPGIEEALGAGIITADEDTFSFRHGLVACAAAELIPCPARGPLHLQFGEILLGRGEATAVAGAHLLKATRSGDPASLAGLDAGVKKIIRSSPQTAADLALHALQLTHPADVAALSRAVAAAEALTAAGRPAQAAQIVHETLAHPVPPHAEASLRSALSSILNMSGQAREAAAQAEAALSLSDLGGDLRDYALAALLQAATVLSDEQTAAPVAAILVDPADHASHVVAAARTARAMTSWSEGRISQALELLRQAARDSGVSPDARHCQPLLVLCARLIDLRQLDQAASVLDAADSRAPHGSLAQIVLSILRGRMHLAGGRLDDAAAEGEAAIAAAAAVGADAYASVARSLLGTITLRRGDLQAAAGYVAGCPVPLSSAAAVYAPAETGAAASLVCSAGEDPRAVAGQIRELCADPPALRRMLLGDPALGACLVRAALACGEHAAAERSAASTGALAGENPECRVVAAAAAHARGLLAADGECLARAAAQHPDSWARASAAEDLAVLLAGRAGREQAVEHLCRALGGYETVGAATDMARVRARLRKLGVRRRHWRTLSNRPVIGWESLTGTEHAVSELVAQGLTNHEIADRMYISQHTVAHHLRQAFRKLSIDSRVELARMVVERSWQPSQA